MRINACDYYNQKMYEINEKINSKLSLAKSSQSFKTVFQNTIGENTSFVDNSNSYSTTAGVQSNTATEKLSSTSSSAVIDLDNTGAFANSKASTFTSEYDDIISAKSKQHGVNENVIKAMIQAESDFNPNCVSSAGAKGLMQLMPCNVKDLGITDVFDPVQNIDGGIREFKGYLKNYDGDIKIALACYNCGPTRVRNLGITNLDDPEQFAKLPKETRNYITKIMKNLQ